jgi:hypothetical protein
VDPVVIARGFQRAKWYGTNGISIVSHPFSSG